MQLAGVVLVREIAHPLVQVPESLVPAFKQPQHRAARLAPVPHGPYRLDQMAEPAGFALAAPGVAMGPHGVLEVRTKLRIFSVLLKPFLHFRHDCIRLFGDDRLKPADLPDLRHKFGRQGQFPELAVLVREPSDPKPLVRLWKRPHGPAGIEGDYALVVRWLPRWDIPSGLDPA